MNFQKDIRALRINKNLSQNDVAKKMKYGSPQFVSNWERGVSYIPLKDIKKVAKIYEVDPVLLAEKMIADILGKEINYYETFLNKLSSVK